MAGHPSLIVQTASTASHPHWQEVRTLGVHPHRRSSHSAVAWNHRLVIYGGQDLREGLVPGLWVCTINELDTSEELWEQWELAENNPPPLSHHSAILYQDQMYLFGGIDSLRENATVYILNLHTKQVSSKSPDGPQLPPGIDSHSAVLHTHDMVVFGGFIGGSRTNRVFSLDLSALQWREIAFAALQPAPRSCHTAVVHQNSMFVFAGIGDDNVKYSDLWELNLISWEWKQISCEGEVPEGRSGHTACCCENYMVVFGGSREITKETNEMWAFNFDALQWKLLQEERTIEDPVSAAQLEEYKKGKSFKTHSPHTAPAKHHTESPNSSPHEVKRHAHLYDGPPSPLVGRIIGRAPYPRDGHSAVLVEDKMLVFGGDRYQMPFNDLYAYSLADSSRLRLSRGKLG